MIRESDLNGFKQHTISARSIFSIREVDKNTCYEFVRRYHYLANAKFFCVHGYAMYYHDEYGSEEMVGCATFSNPQGTSAMKGWFDMKNDCNDVLELSRLCLLPCLNKTNATSFLLGNSMKLLKRHGIRAVITLADSSRHVGSIYQVCNFKYYGLTDRKKDFFTIDGYKNPRGQTSNKHGVWVERSRKHRYCYLLDKKMKVLYKEQKAPSVDSKYNTNCCNGTHRIYDPRFQEWFSCPICCGYIKLLKDNEETKCVKIKNTKEYESYGQLSLF